MPNYPVFKSFSAERFFFPSFIFFWPSEMCRKKLAHPQPTLLESLRLSTSFSSAVMIQTSYRKDRKQSFFNPQDFMVPLRSLHLVFFIFYFLSIASNLFLFYSLPSFFSDKLSLKQFLLRSQKIKIHRCNYYIFLSALLLFPPKISFCLVLGWNDQLSLSSCLFEHRKPLAKAGRIPGRELQSKK